MTRERFLDSLIVSKLNPFYSPDICPLASIENMFLKASLDIGAAPADDPVA